jgi:dolichol-phosphate mannosyltransferase
MLISLISPMYNEESNIEQTLKELQNEMSKYPELDYEIIFIDDGSTDNSLAKANSLKDTYPKLKIFGYPKNQGRGKALRTGFNHATGDIIITLDFDLSYSADHIGMMLDVLIKEPVIDAVLVSAYMPGGKTIGVPKFRLFLSKLGNLIYRFAFSQPIYTSTCVVRAYRKTVIKYLTLFENDKEIHLEIISKLLANGFVIKEIPGTLTSRKSGKSKFRFRRTSLNHLIYFFHEKPFIVFGLLGSVFIILGIISTFMIIYTRFSGDVEFTKTLVGRIASPNFVILNFIFGFQFIGLGFLGAQNSIIKKEIFRIQRQLEFNFMRMQENEKTHNNNN